MAVEPNTKVRAIFVPEETQLMLAAITASIAACKRGMNSGKSPQFRELYERDMKALIALELKIRGLDAQ